MGPKVAKSSLRVLLIEDNPDDAHLVQRALKKDTQNQFELIWVDRVSKGIERLKEDNVDIILVDLSLPDSDRLSVISKIQAITKVLPIVILTGTYEEQLWVDAMRGGAQDYLRKDEMSYQVLVRTLCFAYERNRMQMALQESRMKLAEAQRLAHIGNWEFLFDGQAMNWSDEMFRLHGMEPSPEAVTYEKFSAFIHPDDRSFVRRMIDESVKSLQPFQFEYHIVRLDGEVRWIYGEGKVIINGHGKPSKVFGISQDITHRKQFEEALAKKVTELENLNRIMMDREDRILELKEEIRQLKDTSLPQSS